MTHKKKNKTKVNKPTKSKAHSLNQARSKKQSNTTSTDDNSTTPPTDDNNNSTPIDENCTTPLTDNNNNSAPTDDNSKKSNRGCLGFKKPRWFLWSFFPDDKVPPTQSILEITIYVLVLYFCVDLFLDFNIISHNIIEIEANKLESYRYVSHSVKEDSIYYVHYQRADLNIEIPMTLESNYGIQKGKFYGFLRDDSIRIRCSKQIALDLLSFSENGLYLHTNLNPYWHVVFDMSSRISGYRPIPFKKNRTFENSFYDIRDNNLKKFRFPKYKNYYLELLKESIPDSLSNDMKNLYHFRFTSNIVNGSSRGNIKDTLWRKTDDNIDTLKYKYKLEGMKEIRNEALEREGIIIRNNNKLKYNEKLSANNQSNEYNRLYDRLLNFTKSNEARNDVMYRYTRPYNYVGTDFGIQMNNCSRYQKTTSVDMPGWFDRHDISKAWYHINVNSASIDSINLKLDFVGSTEFSSMKITPDEIGANYIKFTDPFKILQIRKEGLIFYATFKDLENKQAIRCFALTAIMSGLIILLLTFLIIGLYRTLNTIKKYIFKKQ